MEPREPQLKTEVRFEIAAHLVICGLIEKFCINDPRFIGGFKAAVYTLVKIQLLKRFPEYEREQSLTIENVGKLIDNQLMVDAQCMCYQIMVNLKVLEERGTFIPGFIICQESEPGLEFPWGKDNNL